MIDRRAILQKVFALHSHYQNGQIPTLPHHEVNPGLERRSRENALYFTLPPCINFQRSSPAMWRSALATWNDPKTNYLFFPEQTAERSVAAVRRDLAKHSLSLQKNKHTDIWLTISQTLHSYYTNDPRAVLEAGEYDAAKILTLLQEDACELFPYLRGPKLANYWLYILSRYTDLPLTNMHAISIIPDTHVMQCSVRLGLVDDTADSRKVSDAWRELLTGTRLRPMDIHPVLWNWSRNDFLPEV